MEEILTIVLDKIILAILISIISSGIFLFLLTKFRPIIDISPVISKGNDTNSGKTIYRIKIINRTKSPIVEVKARLHIVKRQQTATGEIYKTRLIELKQPELFELDEFNKLDTDANYAYRFITYTDLDSMWSDDAVQFIRFKIYAKHSISGLGATAMQEYRLKRVSIQNGEFHKGDSFKIS